MDFASHPSSDRYDGWNSENCTYKKIKLCKRQKLPMFKEGEMRWCAVGLNVGTEVYGKGGSFTRPVIVAPCPRVNFCLRTVRRFMRQLRIKSIDQKAGGRGRARRKKECVTMADSLSDVQVLTRTAPVKADLQRKIKSLCVYCGSSAGQNSVYTEAAQDLGALMAANDIELVYGGGGNGLMGTLARAVLTHGGRVTGIIPDFLRIKEGDFREVTEHIVVPDMHVRKKMMFDRADAFIAFPGGVGTLEELIEVMTWAQLGRHGKPILIANINDFWQPLLALLDHMRLEGFIRPDMGVSYKIATTVDEILTKICTESFPIPDRWALKELMKKV